jgi:hypothetical protein
MHDGGERRDEFEVSPMDTVIVENPLNKPFNQLNASELISS